MRLAVFRRRRLDKLEEMRLAGIKSVALSVTGRGLQQSGFSPDEACMLRVGECQAAALLFDAAGEPAKAENWRDMADVWLKIAANA